MKVGAYGAACSREHAARKTHTEKVGTFFIIDNFVGLFLNLYGRSMVAI
jgi:hypothetical protein